MEVHHPKGSARLLHLCLPGSRLHIGEVFAPEQLLQALWAPLTAGDAPRQPVLLYPSTVSAAEPPATRYPLCAVPAQAARVRLVVLDGTWRKSRKMLYLNPPLHALPRLVLAGEPPSAYQIRKAHQPAQLSSLEACAAALAQLEGQGDVTRFVPLLAAFSALVAQQCCFGFEAASAVHSARDTGQLFTPPVGD